MITVPNSFYQCPTSPIDHGRNWKNLCLLRRNHVVSSFLAHGMLKRRAANRPRMTRATQPTNSRCAEGKQDLLGHLTSDSEC